MMTLSRLKDQMDQINSGLKIDSARTYEEIRALKEESYEEVSLTYL